MSDTKIAKNSITIEEGTWVETPAGYGRVLLLDAENSKCLIQVDYDEYPSEYNCEELVATDIPRDYRGHVEDLDWARWM